MKFLRQQVNYKKRIPKNWRKPKGRHSKVREQQRGVRIMPEIGYRKSRSERLKSQSIIMIKNIKDIESLKKGTKAKLASGIGNKKKMEILETCSKKGIIVLNYKKTSEIITKIKESFSKRKESKAKKMKTRHEKKPTADDTKKKVIIKKKSVAKKAGDENK